MKRIAIEETYVSFKTAMLLKKKGFDYMCDRIYNMADKQVDFEKYIQNIEEDNFWWCPSQAVAMKWLREKHWIITIIPNTFFADGSVASWNYGVWADDNLEVDAESYNSNAYKSYEECVEAALQYCLERKL